MSWFSFFEARYFSVKCTDFAERTIGTGLGIPLLTGIDLNISLQDFGSKLVHLLVYIIRYHFVILPVYHTGPGR